MLFHNLFSESIERTFARSYEIVDLLRSFYYLFYYLFFPLKKSGTEISFGFTLGLG